MSTSTSAENHNEGGGLPDPPLKTGSISSASAPELREGVDWYETWAGRAGWAVAIAVLVEVPLILFPPCNHWVEKILSAICTLVVGLGVAGEVLFSKRASVRQAILLARSEEKLAAATEQLAPRALNKEQYEAIQSLRGKVKGVAVMVQAASEPKAFATNILVAFQSAGIEIMTLEPPAGAFWTGILILEPNSPFRKPGVPHEGSVGPLTEAFRAVKLFGGGGQIPLEALVPEDWTLVIVGEKLLSYVEPPYWGPTTTHA